LPDGPAILLLCFHLFDVIFFSVAPDFQKFAENPLPEINSAFNGDRIACFVIVPVSRKRGGRFVCAATFVKLTLVETYEFSA